MELEKQKTPLEQLINKAIEIKITVHDLNYTVSFFTGHYWNSSTNRSLDKAVDMALQDIKQLIKEIEALEGD